MLPIFLVVLAIFLGVGAMDMGPVSKCAKETCESSKTSQTTNDFMQALNQLNFDNRTCMFTDSGLTADDTSTECKPKSENDVVLVCTDDSNKVLGCDRQTFDASKDCDSIGKQFVDFYNKANSKCGGGGGRRRRSVYGCRVN